MKQGTVNSLVNLDCCCFSFYQKNVRLMVLLLVPSVSKLMNLLWFLLSP